MNFMPIFEAAAHQLRSAFGEDGKLKLGKVDCLEHPGLENRFNVGKYPTVRIVRFGRVRQKEYRGQRSRDAIVQFVYNELRDPIDEFQSMNDLQKLPNQKNMIIGYFEQKDLLEYEVFRKSALTMRDHCQFHASFGEAAMSMSSSGKNKIKFVRNLAHDNQDLNNEYSGSLTGFSEMLRWFQEKCRPLVRELTFENAEEISEEGRQFVILFHNKSDSKSVQEFENVIEAELMNELDNINFLTADGASFSHPLYHLDKSEEDLPLIVIDSFVHMYLFPNYSDIHTPGKLKEFIGSLFSGDLHVAYHLKDDLAETVREDNPQDDRGENELTSEEIIQGTTTPQSVYKSKFRKLLPSRNRYTFAREEL
ncbi:endoplasmic reticulum resident protein 44 [Drosophila innubila]|uniref:endoplasmic reticulum resident protein 44 n=1 Tax=Drosophila innubila TaxID=198719 RepID=UPI00148DF759|nr:endoplasmic reticulum resident protein 44 [Drosophila innubila]